MTVYLTAERYSVELCSKLLSNVSRAEHFDYGHTFDILTKDRAKWVCTVNYQLSDLITGEQFDVDKGYIRDAYSYNLLNEVQLPKLVLGNVVEETGKLTDITDKLKLWVLAEDEMCAVKNKISFPVLP